MVFFFKLWQNAHKSYGHSFLSVQFSIIFIHIVLQTQLRYVKVLLKHNVSWDFPAAQWFRLHASSVEGWVQSLVRELRSYMPCGVAKIIIMFHVKFF